MKTTKNTLRLMFKLTGKLECWTFCSCGYNMDGICGDMGHKEKLNPIDRECARVRYLLDKN